MISSELKSDLNKWFDQRIRNWEQLRRLHHSILGLKRDEAMNWQQMVDDIIFTYSEIGTTLVDGEGSIRCLPREIKQDIVPYIKRKAVDYSPEVAKQAIELADTLQNRVPACSGRGTPQGAWLRRRGYTRDDLVVKDNITQVGKLRSKVLEVE